MFQPKNASAALLGRGLDHNLSTTVLNGTYARMHGGPVRLASDGKPRQTLVWADATRPLSLLVLRNGAPYVALHVEHIPMALFLRIHTSVSLLTYSCHFFPSPRVYHSLLAPG